MSEPALAEREFAYTDRDFAYFRQLAYELAGIRLADAKREMVYSRLSRCTRRLGLADMASYAALLRDGDPAERTAFINAMTTNLTAWFREAHHFTHLREEVLPDLLARSGGRVRIWSCAASTGEEPYSLALVARAAMQAHPGADLRILASDIDSDVLARASAGVYDEAAITAVPASLRPGGFLRGRGALAGRVKVHPDVAALVRFRQVNLLDPWPMRGPFDVVFCRNVVIYFDKPTQRRLFDRLADLMPPGALLYLGHSESLYHVSERFTLVGRTIYRRTA